MLMQGFAHYQPVWQRWPPASQPDAQGRPMHSWRVILVRYLVSGDLPALGSYRTNEAWNSPHNSTIFGNKVLGFFHAPAQNDWRSDTGYVAVVDPAAGPDEILMILEVEDSGIHWMEPRDLTVDEAFEAVTAPRRRAPRRCHRQGAWAGLRDGTVQWIPSDITLEEFRGLLARPKAPPTGAPVD